MFKKTTAKNTKWLKVNISLYVALLLVADSRRCVTILIILSVLLRVYFKTQSYTFFLGFFPCAGFSPQAIRDFSLWFYSLPRLRILLALFGLLAFLFSEKPYHSQLQSLFFKETDEIVLAIVEQILYSGKDVVLLPAEPECSVLFYLVKII